jgi:ureidoglycolate lyase
MGDEMRTLHTEPLTRDAFAPFGQVIEAEGAHHYPINAGNCERYHDLARVELGGVHPRPLISLLHSRGFELPLDVRLVERHPLGSQAFYPLGTTPFLVVVAPDESGTPWHAARLPHRPRPGRQPCHEHLARRADADRPRRRFPLH